MTNERFANVWDAIAETPAEAESLKLQSSLIIALTDHIKAQGWSIDVAADRLGETPARVAQLLKNDFNAFDLAQLVSLVGTAGLHIEVSVAKAA